MKRITLLILTVLFAACLLFSACAAKRDPVEYLSWRFEDWAEADDNDRIECCRAYIRIIDPDSDIKHAEAYLELVDKALKENPGLNIKELASIAINAQVKNNTSKADR